MQHPTEEDARRIVEDITGEKATEVQRFLTGKAHYVYEVMLPHRTLVIRITRKDMAGFFKGAIHWYPILQEQSVPLPKLHYSTPDPKIHGFPVMIMDRLPGNDLGDVYKTLTVQQKKKLAADIATFQLKVQELPPGRGFGYATSPNDPKLHKNWKDVVCASLDRSEKRIKEGSALTQALIDKTRVIVNRHSRYFSQIEPYGFLDDTTTKNVIIDRGIITGVVDVDFVCYGDIVQLLGLINMALLEISGDTDYVDYLSVVLSLDKEQIAMIDVYTLISGIDFLSVHGHAFNTVTVEQIDESKSRHLLTIINEYLEKLS